MSRRHHRHQTFSLVPDELKEDQKAKLREFRWNVNDIIQPDHDDRFMLKWLVARKFDVKKAENMYRKSMQWRAEIGADTILENYKRPEVLKSYYPGGLFGEDLEGRPIWLDPIGNVDLRGILFSVKKSDIVRNMVYSVELIRRQFKISSEKHGRPIDQCLHLVDMTGFGSNFLWKPAVDLYIEIVRMLEDNYPEVLKKTYIIKAPKVFKAAYTIFKGFVDEGTAKKMVLLDEHWEDTMYSMIDREQLPWHYGGKQVDPDGDPKCQSRISYGGKVPETFHKKKDEFFPPDVEVVKETVSRGGKHQVKVEVTKPNSSLSWVFATESGVIFFSVYQLCNSEHEPKSKKELSKAEKSMLRSRKDLECHRVPEDGSVVCETPGMYYLEFENESRLNSRKLMYTVKVDDGGGQAFPNSVKSQPMLSTL